MKVFWDERQRALEGCDALVVSLGLGAHRDEPLGVLGVGDDGFARAGSPAGRAPSSPSQRFCRRGGGMRR